MLSSLGASVPHHEHGIRHIDHLLVALYGGGFSVDIVTGAQYIFREAVGIGIFFRQRVDSLCAAADNGIDV